MPGIFVCARPEFFVGRGGLVDHGGHAKGRVGWRDDRAECANAAEHRRGWCSSPSVWSVAPNVRATKSNYRTVICKKLSIPCTTAWLFMTHMIAWWCLTKGRLSSTLIPDGC